MRIERFNFAGKGWRSRHPPGEPPSLSLLIEWLGSTIVCLLVAFIHTQTHKSMTRPTRGILFLTLAVIGCSKRSDVQSSDSSIVIPPATSQSVAKPDTSKPINPPFDTKAASVNNLPDSVRPYVASLYPGYAIVSAVFDPLCGGGPAIDVSIKRKGHPTYSLIFKPSGEFVQREEDVPGSTAPAKVLKAVKKEYAAFKAGRLIEKLTLSDNTVEYLVDLSKGKIQKEVIFSPDGAVICDSKE